MLGVVVSRVRPEKLDELRRWMTELTVRRDEVLESFRREGMHQEMAVLVHSSDGPLLIYAMDADDIAAEGAAYRASDLAIDREQHRVLSDVLEGPVSSEVLYEMP